MPYFYFVVEKSHFEQNFANSTRTSGRKNFISWKTFIVRTASTCAPNVCANAWVHYIPCEAKQYWNIYKGENNSIVYDEADTFKLEITTNCVTICWSNSFLCVCPQTRSLFVFEPETSWNTTQWKKGLVPYRKVKLSTLFYKHTHPNAVCSSTYSWVSCLQFWIIIDASFFIYSFLMSWLCCVCFMFMCHNPILVNFVVCLPTVMFK